jgi:hypothetical protein
MISQLFEHHLLPQEAKAKHKATLLVTLLRVITSYSSSTNHIFKQLQKHTIGVLLFKRQDFTIN